MLLKRKVRLVTLIKVGVVLVVLLAAYNVISRPRVRQTLPKLRLYHPSFPRFRPEPPKHTDKLYPINPKHLCSSARFVELVICVMSRVETFEFRQLVRQTWGAYVNKTNSDVALLFFTGVNQSESKLQSVAQEDIKSPSLREESEKFGDIVQVDLRESFKNLALKALFSLRWVHTYCPDANFMLKIDEDVYVNIPNWLTALRTLERSPRRAPFIHGEMIHTNYPLRDRRHKYFWSDFELEDPKNVFPTYVRGSSYAISRSAYEPLLKASMQVREIPRIEDAYICGVLADKADVTLVHDWTQPVTRVPTNSYCDWRHINAAHGYSPREFVAIHNTLFHNTTLNCRL